MGIINVFSYQTITYRKRNEMPVVQAFDLKSSDGVLSRGLVLSKRVNDVACIEGRRQWTFGLGGAEFWEC